MGVSDVLDGCPKGMLSNGQSCYCIPGTTNDACLLALGQFKMKAQECPQGMHRVHNTRDYGYDPNNIVCQLNCDGPGEKADAYGKCIQIPTVAQPQSQAYQYKTLDSDIAMLMGFGVIGALIFLFVRHRAKSKQAALDASPEHPFKVNVVVEPMQGDKIINVIRGRKLTHILKMDVKISLRDWQRIKDAGLYDAVLFDYPDTTSTYSGERMTCHVRELQNPIGVSFYNIGEAEAAKEKLIEGLYDLRSAIDVHRAPAQVERLEI